MLMYADVTYAGVEVCRQGDAGDALYIVYR
jgi:hypothetical protein